MCSWFYESLHEKLQSTSVCIGSNKNSGLDVEAVDNAVAVVSAYVYCIQKAQQTIAIEWWGGGGGAQTDSISMPPLSASESSSSSKQQVLPSCVTGSAPQMFGDNFKRQVAGEETLQLILGYESHRGYFIILSLYDV